MVPGDDRPREVSVLPEPMAAVLADYERHLTAERDLAAHTVRAYLGDLAGMLEHAAMLGHTDVSTLDVRTLRS
jgi:integrase/recombinase XerC